MRKVHSSQELEKVDISDSFKQARASKNLVGHHFGIPVRLSKNDRGIDWVKLGSGLEVPLDEIERYNEDTVDVVAWDEELNKNVWYKISINQLRQLCKDNMILDENINTDDLFGIEYNFKMVGLIDKYKKLFVKDLKNYEYNGIYIEDSDMQIEDNWTVTNLNRLLADGSFGEAYNKIDSSSSNIVRDTNIIEDKELESFKMPESESNNTVEQDEDTEQIDDLIVFDYSDLEGLD